MLYNDKHMKIGIFGGSFDPVHLGHIMTARSVSKELGLDKLFMVVAANPPHKDNTGRLPGCMRYRMLDAAVKNEELIFPSDVELKREGKSYTVDIVTFYKNRYRGAEIFLIVGGDMLENFPLWREPKLILEKAKLAAVTRPDASRDMRAIADDIEKRFGGKVLLSEFTGPEISSTEIRNRMKDAIPVDTMVAKPTELYMYENALYMPPELIEIRNSLSARLRRKRLNHTMMTVCEAIKLAYHYGVDTRKARLAALLHDCVKLPNKELLDFCTNNHQEISDEEKANPYLIHARLGAIFASEEFGVKDEEVLQAIRYHTIGHVGMSMLDKIVYVADKIECTRDYEGVDDIRRMAYNDINRAMLLAMKHSADYTVASGKTINPYTESVMSYLENEIKNTTEV